MAKFPGYAGFYLEVDLTAKTSKKVDLDPKLARDYIGGRAMGVKMLMDAYKGNWKNVDPLGPDALLILNEGPLNGFLAGKVNASFKSPLNGMAYGSSGSSDFNAQLRFAGYDGIIIKGKASSPVTLVIEDDKVTFDDASKLWGQPRDAMYQAILDKYGSTVTPLFIGQAGENLVKYASIMTGLYRACGRGGSGAVMGSKNLKAIVCKGNGPMPEVADLKVVNDLMEWIRVNTPINRFSFHEYGTTSLVFTCGNVTSAEPVRNWQSEWHDHAECKGEVFGSDIWVRRYWADYACTVACSKLGRVKDINSKRIGQIGELPDYEAGGLLGTNLGIFKVDDMLFACDLSDLYGFDTISLGNVLSWACELQEKGILTAADCNGIALKWGDADAFAKLTELIVKKEGIGKTLAEGELAASKIIGKDSYKYTNMCKGLEMGAHGARSGKDKNPISYTMSTHGGDHTSNPSNTKTPENPIWADSLVQCSFLGLTEDQQIQFLNGVTGFGVTKDEKLKMVKRWTTLQWITNRLSGWTYADDVNPPRWYEPLPEGPFKGQAIDPKVEEQMKQEYFTFMGWDAKGIPTKDAMVTYGLDAFESIVAPLRS